MIFTEYLYDENEQLREFHDYDHCKDMIEGLMLAVFETGDPSQVENYLEELACCFKVRMHPGEPKIQTRR